MPLEHDQLEATGPFTLIGGTGLKSFTDNGIPPGTARVVYQLFSTRGGQNSPFSEPVMVFLGVPPSDQAEALKIAA